MPITGYSNTISVTTLAPSLLLDLYPSAAAAFSVRKLRNAYTGSAIRVRRSSDNAEQDIGFSGGNLDTSALTSFCSGTNGFVTTWYDQSGNGVNISTSIASEQPLIVQTGVVNLVNSKPALQYGHNSLYNRLIGAYSTPQPYFSNTLQSTYSVFNFWNFVNGTYPRLFTQNDNNGTGANGYDYQQGLLPLLQNASQNIIAQYVGGMANFANDITINLLTQYLNASYKTSNVSVSFGIQNNALISQNVSTMTYPTNQITHIGIGGAIASPKTEIGYFNMQESINYYTDNSADRTAIQTNINDYYGIY